ncbi:MAG: allophanate hydrolase [Pseudonocardiales bacterium]|nr:allophanate hydrolase [Pseudonocardiales bacterium]
MSHSPTDRVRAAYRRIAEADRPEVWITLCDEHDLLVAAKEIEDRLAGGEQLPLAGLLVAVKDNIDVAGLPTTAACPSYAYTPGDSATAVRRLTDAGALVLGKTNLDQFATGLVGTRSPYGAVRHAHLPERISGGSSSGSAVAVALGIADLALGTDTAGSGRVPAALHGLVGLKPTLGLVPNTGVVPAARPYDCVTVFAATLTLAQRGIAAMTGPDPLDPRSRTWPDSVRLAAGARPRVAVPDAAGLAPLSAAASAAFHAAAERLEAGGAVVEAIDVRPFLTAATLLYEGALVAERYAAVGEFLEGRAGRDSRADDGIDPTVAGIILAAKQLPAYRLAADLELLDRHRVTAAAALAGFDALLLPTTTGHPTLAEVRAEPVAVNSRMGVYTNFVNLLDMAAVAVPAGTADGGPFGVSVITRAFDDQIGIDIAALLTGEQADVPLPPTGIDLAVFGAHLRGHPLNGELTTLGARFAGTVATAPEYRMFALPTEPPKPGVLRVAAGGAALPGERWTLSPAALGRFLAGLPAPMSLGVIELDDGGTVLGFHCNSVAAEAGVDITHHGGWPAYLASAPLS